MSKPPIDQPNPPRRAPAAFSYEDENSAPEASRAERRKPASFSGDVVLTPDEVQRLRQVTDEFVERARSVTAHNEIYDLEDSHTPENPRVRRIKTAHLHHPEYGRLVRHPKILAVLQDLWGPDIRFDTAKLNLKSAGFGAPVEWHQDWAFYPHTNDDLAAVGVMFDDMELANGPFCTVSPIIVPYSRDKV